MTILQSIRSTRAGTVLLCGALAMGIASCNRNYQGDAIIDSDESARKSTIRYSLYKKNVLDADVIAIGEALQAYNMLQNDDKYIAEKQKLEKAEHYLRVAQYNRTYEDMKKAEQKVDIIKNSGLLAEGNKLQHRIDSLRRIKSDDYNIGINGFAGIYQEDIDNYAKRYQEVTGRSIYRDADSVYNLN